jgi:hypothetical protein
MPTCQFTPQTPGHVQERLHDEMGELVDDVNWRDPGAVIADEEDSIPSSIALVITISTSRTIASAGGPGTAARCSAWRHAGAAPAAPARSRD